MGAIEQFCRQVFFFLFFFFFSFSFLYSIFFLLLKTFSTGGLGTIRYLSHRSSSWFFPPFPPPLFLPFFSPSPLLPLPFPPPPPPSLSLPPSLPPPPPRNWRCSPFYHSTSPLRWSCHRFYPPRNCLDGCEEVREKRRREGENVRKRGGKGKREGWGEGEWVVIVSIPQEIALMDVRR